MHAGSTPQRDTFLEEDDSTAKVPFFAQNLARRLAGMEEISFPQQSTEYAVVPAPTRPRPFVLRPRIRAVQPRAAMASIAEDESTTKIPAHEIAEALAEADAAPPSTEPLEFAKSAPFLEVAEPLPVSRSGVVAVDPLPRLQSAPSLEVFESYSDDSEEVANDNITAPASVARMRESAPEVFVEERASSSPDPSELSDDELAASLGLAPSKPAAPEAKRPLFPWIASTFIAAASLALCAVTVHNASAGHGVVRTPHVLTPMAVHACIDDLPARTLAMSSASMIAKPQPVVTHHHRVPAVSARASAAVGIVRDAPF
jgi:hypothetical protein